VHVQTHTAEATEALGRRLAQVRPGPDALVVVYFQGEIGAGKTTFARGFLNAAGVAGPVRSPTYTLLELHELEQLTLLHVDLYRLRDVAELESLGLRDWARPGCLWLIEWAERGGAHLPAPDLILTFAVGSPAHDVDVRAGSPSGEAWLARLASRATP